MKGSSKEYFLGKVFDNSLDAIIVTDTKGYITEANKAFMKLVGYNKKEVIGKHMVEFSPMKEGTYESTSGELIHLDKKFQDYIKSTMASFVEKGKLHNAMGYQLRKDGKIVPVEDNMVFLFDNKGGRSGAFAVIREITEQKQVEDELRKSKDYAENIIESSIDSIVVVDMSGVLTRVNSAFLQLTGFSKEEVLGKHMPELVPTSAGTYKCTTGELIQIDEKFFKIVESNMLQFQEKGSMQNAINYLLRKDNKLVPVEDNMVYLLDREGKRIGAVAITRDITDRRKAEQEIRKTKEYLENIFRTSVDGVIIADDEGTISAVNKATEKIFDCSSNQLVGKPFREMEFDAKKLKVSGKELMDTMFREGTISGVERTWKKPDGTSVVVEMNIALLKDDEGNMTGSVASIRDITDRKRAEEALKESEERYQKLIETANDAIFIVDAETGSILNANKKAGELLGIPSEKIIGMHHTVMHAKEDEAYYRKLFYDNAQKEGGIILDDVFVWHRKGYRIPVEISSSAVKVGGRMVMQGIFRDITDRKRAEEALKQSE
jgi:PAS domain S-box-containing protein